MRATLVYRGCHREGGVERVVWETARNLSLRHEVTVVSADVHGLPDRVHILRTPPHPTLTSFRVDATAALPDDPGTVVTFGSDCPVGDVLVMTSVHRAWLQAGSSLQIGPLRLPNAVRWLLPRHRVRLRMEREAVVGTRSKIIPVSQSVADDLNRIYGIPPARMEVVPHGFDPEQFSPQRGSDLRPQMRQDLHIYDRDVVLLLVANEYHRKGLGVLLQAMASIGEPRLKLMLVGRMSPTAYGDQIRRLGLRDQVRYCGRSPDVAYHYAAADLLVLPTQYEPFGLVILEALAAGLPVITTALAGASSLVLPGVNGLLQRDPLDAKELESLLAEGLDPATRTAWAGAAPPSVAGYEWPAVMRHFESALEQVADSPPQ